MEPEDLLNSINKMTDEQKVRFGKLMNLKIEPKSYIDIME